MITAMRLVRRRIEAPAGAAVQPAQGLSKEGLELVQLGFEAAPRGAARQADLRPLTELKACVDVELSRRLHGARRFG